MRISKRKRVFLYTLEELEGALYIIYLPIEILRNICMRYALWVRFLLSFTLP